MTAPLFVVDKGQLAAERIVLAGAEGRHAATVMRLAPGERVDVTDGEGGLARCVVGGAVGRGELALHVLHRGVEPEPSPRFVVVQALAKGDRGELAVAAMTELGVDVVVPWAAARSVARWSGQRGDKALTRWRATAREAAKLSRRARFPEIRALASTAQVAQLVGGAALAVILHEEASEPVACVSVPPAGDVVIVVGPEGGITAEEIAAFAAAGAPTWRLGPTVLRTSTAGVAALAVLLSRTARWAAAPGD